jgi:hypothetical protein
VIDFRTPLLYRETSAILESDGRRRNSRTHSARYALRVTTDEQHR